MSSHHVKGIDTLVREKYSTLLTESWIDGLGMTFHDVEGIDTLVEEIPFSSIPIYLTIPGFIALTQPPFTLGEFIH